jgi:hypothetical protein
MKKLLFITALALGVAAGVFFAGTTPSAPLSAGILVATNDEAGCRIVCFRITNHTSRPYYFFTYPQALSNGVWRTSLADREIFGGTRGLGPHTNTEKIVGTFQQTGLVQLQITYARPKTPRENKIDGALGKFGLRPLFNNRVRKVITTPPINLSGP